jgi:hypothetical protein
MVTKFFTEPNPLILKTPIVSQNARDHSAPPPHLQLFYISFAST